jgi:hypothetical protein
VPDVSTRIWLSKTTSAMAPVPGRSKPAPTDLKIFADGRIAGAFECFATSVRFEGVLATRFIIRIAFGIVRFTFGNFVVFHIIGTRATSPLTRKNNSQ